MKNFFHLFFLLSSIGLSAQQLHLKSGQYTVPEGTFKGLSVQRATYGALLWNRAVEPQDKEALKTLGVELFHYLPHNAFEAKIPAGTTKEALKRAGVTSFIAWQPEMKLDAPLAQGDIPGWAMRGADHLEVRMLTAEGQFPWGMRQLSITSPLNLGEGWWSATVAVDALPILAASPEVLFLQAAEEEGRPENSNARAAARVNLAHHLSPFKGAGVVVGVGDDGDIGPHIDYTGRLTSLAGPSLGDHGDHVTGTVFGAGNLDPKGEGMAPEATMIYYDYPDNLSNIDQHYTTYGIRVTNSSYSNGCNAGYTAYAQQMDKDAIDNRALVHVFSAGNSNGSNCGYGAGSSWGNITGGHKQGKNVVATANITATDLIAPSSSRGPAADGRIKPDLSSVGTQVYSTISNNTYAQYTGTSMASPGVAGFFTLLHGAFDSLQQSTAPGGLLKAIAMNTANDLGNAGPDFIYGYGLINARRALETIETGRFEIDTLTTGDSLTFDFSVPSNATTLRAMVYWTDAEGSTFASKALVNNLDFKLVTPQNTTYLPWVLDPTPSSITLNNVATRGVDTLNNAEQVTLNNPPAGTYTAKISGTNIPSGPQEFYLVWSYDTVDPMITFPSAGDVLEPGTSNYIRWDGEATSTSFNWSLSLDSGQTFQSLSANPIAGRNLASFTVPNSATAGAYIRVQNGTTTHTSGPFTILGTPTNLSLDWVCPDSLKLDFNPVTSATSYTAHLLGSRYMDSVAHTSVAGSIIVPLSGSSGTWASVSARLGSSNGERAYAIEVPSGLNNCPLARDAGITLQSPQAVISCFQSQLFVSVVLSNPGTSVIDSVPIAYQLANNAVVWDTLFAALPPYSDTSFTFTTPLPWSGTAPQLLSVWAALNGDLNSYNDSTATVLNYLNSSLVSLPVQESFDNFFNCTTASNCAAGQCALSNGFRNASNGSEDDIDWRTNSGGTPSSGTGPSSGFGNAGKYLYLEASGSCTFQDAVLTSPCIDLSTAISPQLSLAYHMSGANTGDLRISVMSSSGGELLGSFSGDQGPNWNTFTYNLSDYVGDTVVIHITGTTGSDYDSDIAIDQFVVEDLIGAPVADFTANTTAPCLQAPIVLQDLSAKTPNSWQWSISPSTYQFVGGTSANDAQPQVAFTAYGSYSISLVVTNAYGTDSLTKTNFIEVTPLSSELLAEVFNGGMGSQFTIENQDNSTTWSTTQVRGASGAYTNAAHIGYFQYNNPGSVDGLRSRKVDLAGMAAPALLFDVSYAPYSALYADSLRVRISTDCGTTFTMPYAKDGTTLSTAGTSTSTWVPSSSADWRTDTIDLSNTSGTQLEFVIEAVNGYGNHLYLDNIRVVDLQATPPAVAVNFPSYVCEDHYFDFGLSSADTSVQGGFVQNRQNSSLVSTFAGKGTHTTIHTSAVTYDYEVAYWNGASFVLDSVQVPTGQKFNVDWSLQQLTSGALTYLFSDLTTPQPSAWAWDFGDGTTSNAQFPTHTFATGGSHTITLVTTTECGVDSLQRSFSTIGIEEGEDAGWVVYPNPTSGKITLQAPTRVSGSVDLSVFNNLGELLERYAFPEAGALHVSLEHLPAGVYTIGIVNQGETLWTKVVKQ